MSIDPKVIEVLKRKMSSENQDKDDIIKKLQEDLKETHDRVKELELKEAFEDAEVNNSYLSENQDKDISKILENWINEIDEGKEDINEDEKIKHIIKKLNV